MQLSTWQHRMKGCIKSRTVTAPSEVSHGMYESNWDMDNLLLLTWFNSLCISFFTQLYLMLRIVLEWSLFGCHNRDLTHRLVGVEFQYLLPTDKDRISHNMRQLCARTHSSDLILARVATKILQILWHFQKINSKINDIYQIRTDPPLGLLWHKKLWQK